MQYLADELILSATDLSGYLGCGHRSALDREAALRRITRPHYHNLALEILQQRGLQHEQEYLEALSAQGLTVVQLTALPGARTAESFRNGVHATLEAMRSGADVIYQATLFEPPWLGYTDFLVRVPRPGTLGAWSYEVVDTKLSREAKGGALLQVMLYSQLLAKLQGVTPELAHIALGGPAPHQEAFRVAEYDAFLRSTQTRLLEHVARDRELAHAPDPVEACGICVWSQRCDSERREVDHLSLVAGIARTHRDTLRAREVNTLQALAQVALPFDPPVREVSRVSLERVHHQARVQYEGRSSANPVHELILPIVLGQGLASLPEPSVGDLFFDLEGDPFALGDGIEYLFGWTDASAEYSHRWALDRASERRVFEEFIDFVTARLEQNPGLHVYHFAPYEPSAVKRLMGRYGTREAEVDALLRGGVFVDLYRAVRNGVRASVESYSIKRLEPFYGFEREVPLDEAGDARAHFEAWLELGGRADQDDEITAAVAGYNRDDCVSTLHLRNWLESLRADAEAATGAPVPRPVLEPFVSAEEDVTEASVLRDRLHQGVPDDIAERSPVQHGRWLLGHVLDYHRRESNAHWWEYFRCAALSDLELIEDGSTLGGLEYSETVPVGPRSSGHWFTYPPQEHGFETVTGGYVAGLEGFANITVVELEEESNRILLKTKHDVAGISGIIPFDDVPDKPLRASLLRTAARVVDGGLEDVVGDSVADLLLRRPPRVGQAAEVSLRMPGESASDAGVRLVERLDHTVLPIQGPPGSGKTYTGAHMIVECLRQGKRVGITALSHKVIANLLDKACEVAAAEGVELRAVQKVKEPRKDAPAQVTGTNNNAEVLGKLKAGEVQVAAGTAWLWCREDMAASVDVLFIDEAGQFPLANALAVTPAAENLVLLGDPKQLDQPQQGVHPPGTAASVLEHLLDGAAVMPPDRGLFLDQTWRLHPDVCAFTSEQFYGSQLESWPTTHLQRINHGGELDGTGLRFIPVTHAGNTNRSEEEAARVRALFDSILGRATWVNDQGVEDGVRLEDILVVAPYNAHVACLRRVLPEGARVGTVDKFQGQEAPIVIFSMATSSPEDAPRGMEFLYSPNRLNVATSRARCIAAIVASPALFAPQCRTPRQMRLANAFCRFLELATASQQDAAVAVAATVP